MRGLLGVLFTGVVALTAGAIGFQAGIASNIGAAGGAVYLGGGIGGFGFLLFLLFIGFVLFTVGGMRRRALGHGPMGGPGRWAGHGPWGTDGDPRRAWVADAHRRLHEEDARAAAGTSSSPSSTGSTTGAGAPSPTDRPAVG